MTTETPQPAEHPIDVLAEIRGNFRKTRGHSAYASVQFPIPGEAQSSLIAAVCNAVFEEGWDLATSYPTHDGYMCFLFRDRQAHRPTLVLPPGM